MLDLKALNESFDRINSIKTSGKLFEYFCEDCSESGIDKEDILDWLSEHEQLWNDCEKHFVQDPTWLSADELEAFICDHDQACKDYADAFGLSFGEEEEFDESCTESFDRFLTEAKISPEDEHDSDILRSIYAKINQKPRRNVEKRFTPEEKAVIDKYNIDLEREYWAGWGRGFNTKGYGKLWSINPKVNGTNLFASRMPLQYDNIDISKANLADKARKAWDRDKDNKHYQPLFDYEKEHGLRYGDTISQKFSNDKKDLENIQNQSSDYQNRIANLEAKISRKKDYIEAARNGKLQGVTEQDIKKAEASIRIAAAELEAIKKEKPYFDSERKKAIDNFYKDRFGKTPQHEDLGKSFDFNKLSDDELFNRYGLSPEDKPGHIPSDEEIKEYEAGHKELLKRRYAQQHEDLGKSLLKKYSHVLKQSVTLYENFNPSKKPLTEAKKDKILDQLDKEDYQLIKSIYPKSTMIIVGHPGNKKVFFIEYEHSGFGGYYHSLGQVFPETKNWNDEGEAYREFFKKIPNWGEPISRKEGQQQEVAYLQSKYDRVLVIPQKKWLQIAQAEVPFDIDDTEPKEDEFDPPVKFYYGVYEIDEDNDELDHISDFDTEEEAIKFAKKQSFPTHVVFIPSIDPDDDPEIAEYMEYNAPYEAYETIWSSLDESFKRHRALKEGANSEGYELVAKDYLLYYPYPTDWDVEDIAEEICANCFDEDYENCDPEISYACYEAARDYLDNAEEDLEEAKEFNFDKLNKKLHGNIRL